MLWPIACRDYRINYYEWTVSHRSIDICMYSYICCINCFFLDRVYNVVVCWLAQAKRFNGTEAARDGVRCNAIRRPMI